MIAAEPPQNEAERLAALRAYDILDTLEEQAYDDLTRIAASICGTPIALVSLVDEERQWFKSRFGLDATETPRNVAFCSHAILRSQELLVVPDSLEDPRFHDNPLATGEPHVRFYAGAPLVTPDGLPLGTLCVIDNQPRELTQEQLESLRALSRQVVSQLELRKNNQELSGLASELVRTNSELQQFTSIAAHDLQEPLRKLIAFSQLLAQDLGDDLPQNASEDLGYITSASRRMQDLVGDLLRLSRAGAAELEREPVALEECARLALDALSFRVAETRAEVRIDPLPTVQGDQTLLTQLFQNLIGNALKFTESDEPRIHVTCRHDERGTVIGVKDNGIGMDPAFAEQVFAPFKRLHGREAYEGTGIGLAITRKVVERHGGCIWVDSQPGAGSHFQFVLESAAVLEAPARAA